MKAITLHQPWARFIAFGWKTIETRGYSWFARLAGQRIAIHAGKRWDDSALQIAAPYLSEARLERARQLLKTDGAVICLADVIGARWLTPADSERALCPCHGRRFGLILSGITPIEPVPWRGAQGIWCWPGPSMTPATPQAESLPLFAETKD